MFLSTSKSIYHHNVNNIEYNFYEIKKILCEHCSIWRKSTQNERKLNIEKISNENKDWYENKIRKFEFYFDSIEATVHWNDRVGAIVE